MFVMEEYVYLSLLNGDEEVPCDGYSTTSYTVDWRWRARRNPDFNELDNSNSTSETVIFLKAILKCRWLFEHENLSKVSKNMWWATGNQLWSSQRDHLGKCLYGTWTGDCWAPSWVTEPPGQVLYLTVYSVLHFTHVLRNYLSKPPFENCSQMSHITQM